MVLVECTCGVRDFVKSFRMADLSLIRRPKRQPGTCVGGCVSMTVLPAALVLYSFIWMNDWYNGDLGSIRLTDVDQLQFGTGYAMNGAQGLYCLAKSGCWYTRPLDQSSCPTATALQKLSATAYSLTTLFETGNISRPDSNKTETECAYAARGQKLEGVCLYATPDPIDKFSVLWHLSSGNSGLPDEFGVALKTESMRQGGTSNYVGTDAASQDSLEGVAGLASQWFRWKSEGGGRGHTVSQTGTEMHYGLVDLQPVEYSYSLAQPKTEALQLIPQYGHTDKTPSENSICHFTPLQAADPQQTNPYLSGPLQTSPPRIRSKCQGGGSTECAQLKIGLTSTVVRNTRSVVSPLNAFLGALGGFSSLLLMTLTFLNAVLILLCGKRCGVCAPTDEESRLIEKVVDRVKVGSAAKGSGLYSDQL